MGSRTGNPAWQDSPSTATPITAARLEAIESAIDGSAPLASPVFTGDPKAPTPATGDNDTSVATTAFVKAQGYAPLASPALTGNPTAPTQTAGNDSDRLATTAFVQAAVAAAGGGGFLSPSRKAGEYLFNALNGGSVNNSFTPVAGTLYCVPYYNTGAAHEIDRIAIQNGAVGGSGAVARLGIWTVGSDGRIGSLILDAGTVDMTSGGDKNITISETIPTGVVLLSLVTNDTACRPRMVGASPRPNPLFWRGVSGPVPSGSAWLSYTGYDATEALPSVGTTDGEEVRAGDVMMIAVRAA